MKRRDVLKGVGLGVVGSVVGLSAAAKGDKPAPEHLKGVKPESGDTIAEPSAKLMRTFTLNLPGPYDELPLQLQERVEGLEAQHPGLVVAQPIQVELSGHSGDALTVEAGEIFKGRRWEAIQRVVNDYWQKYVRPPDPDFTEFCQVTWNTAYLALPGGECQALCDWRTEHLAGVEVSFMGSVPLRTLL